MQLWAYPVIYFLWMEEEDVFGSCHYLELCTFLKYSEGPKIGHMPVSEADMCLGFNLVRLTKIKTKIKPGTKASPNVVMLFFL